MAKTLHCAGGAAQQAGSSQQPLWGILVGSGG